VFNGSGWVEEDATHTFNESAMGHFLIPYVNTFTVNATVGYHEIATPSNTYTVSQIYTVNATTPSTNTAPIIDGASVISINDGLTPEFVDGSRVSERQYGDDTVGFAIYLDINDDDVYHYNYGGLYGLDYSKYYVISLMVRNSTSILCTKTAMIVYDPSLPILLMNESQRDDLIGAENVTKYQLFDMEINFLAFDNQTLNAMKNSDWIELGIELYDYDENGLFQKDTHYITTIANVSRSDGLPEQTYDDVDIGDVGIPVSINGTLNGNDIFEVNLTADTEGNLRIDCWGTALPSGVLLDTPNTMGNYTTIIFEQGSNMSTDGAVNLTNINVTYWYDADDIPLGFTENEIGIFYWDSDNREWRVVDGSYTNVTEQSITASISTLAVAYGIGVYVPISAPLVGIIADLAPFYLYQPLYITYQTSQHVEYCEIYIGSTLYANVSGLALNGSIAITFPDDGRYVITVIAHAHGWYNTTQLVIDILWNPFVEWFGYNWFTRYGGEVMLSTISLAGMGIFSFLGVIYVKRKKKNRLIDPKCDLDDITCNDM